MSYEGMSTWNDAGDGADLGRRRIIVPVMDDGVKTDSIKERAYEDDATVQEIVVPEGIVSIGNSAFRGCTNLREIVLPSTLRSIGDNAFEGCISLWEAKFPDGLTSIGSYAFNRCIHLSVSDIPESVSDIGECAFGGCTAVESFVTEGHSGRYLAEGPALIDLRDNSLIAWAAGDRSVKAIVPECIEIIRPHSFEGCMMESILLPQTLIGATADSFAGCDRLSSIEVCWGSPCFTTSKGILYSNGMAELIFCPPAINQLEIYLNDCIRSIGPHAFKGCDNIRMIDFPTNLEEIGEGAFEGMTRLMVLSIPIGFGIGLPFDLYARNGEPFPQEEIGGKEFVLKEGRYTFSRMYRENEDDSYVDEDDAGFDDENRLLHEMFIQPSKTIGRIAPVSVNGTTLKDVAGNRRMKEEIRNRLLLPSLHPELFSKYGIPKKTGIVMYGPPGTGKTLIARAIAGELNATFFSVKASDILSKYVGEDERKIRDLFESARQHERSVIFFDDFDSLGTKRGNPAEPWKDALVAELLVQMDGLETYDGTMLVLAATNRPWILDQALTRPGRFDTMIHVPMPDAEAREEIFRLNISSVPNSGIDYHVLSMMTAGYSGADIAEICRKAKIRRAISESEGGSEGVMMEDVTGVLDSVGPSVNPASLSKFEEYSAQKNPVEKRKRNQQRKMRPIGYI